MKTGKPHIVPLSRQAVEILRELRPLTGPGRYLLPSVGSARRPMSNNTLIAALRRLGYPKDQMTPHEFRSIASTILNEQGWNRGNRAPACPRGAGRGTRRVQLP